MSSIFKTEPKATSNREKEKEKKKSNEGTFTPPAKTEPINTEENQEKLKEYQEQLNMALEVIQSWMQ